jgi:RNA-binding motif X-linked protein 2
MSYTAPYSWLAYIHFSDDGGSESSASSAPNIDPDDPMRDYLLEKWREERAKKRGKKTKKHKDETPEERRARKERRKEKRARREAKKPAGLKGVEALLRSLHSSGLPK